MPDRSRGAGHQQCAALHRPGDEHAIMRGHARDAEGRALGEGHVVGQRSPDRPSARCIPPRCPSSGRCAGRCRATRACRPNFGTIGADLIDHAGAVTARHDAWIFHRRRDRGADRCRTGSRPRLRASRGPRSSRLPVGELMQRNISLYPMSLPGTPHPARKRAQSDMANWIASGQRILSVAAQFPLYEAAAAHEAVERGDKVGTVVIDCAR